MNRPRKLLGLGKRVSLDVACAAMVAQGYYVNRRTEPDLPDGIYSIERDADTGALELYRWDGDNGVQVGYLAHS